MSTAVVGGGISGMAAAYFLARAGEDVTLFEASPRLGGTVETASVQLPGCGTFCIELGPDGWVAEKPWLEELARELGLGDSVVDCDDAERRTLLLRGKELVPLPAQMRMFVPTDVDALEPGALLSERAIAAFRQEPSRAAELRALAVDGSDVTVADFVRRHFGEEITRTLAAPLLAGIIGGDVERLSARSVLPAFVAMEKEHGSLVSALAAKQRDRQRQTPTFRTLSTGLGSIIAAMEEKTGAARIRCNIPVEGIARDGHIWRVSAGVSEDTFDSVILATPAHVTQNLLAPVDADSSALLAMPASSAIVVALVYGERVPLPRGFGFLVENPAAEPEPALLATTFMHQKYPHTAPQSGMLLRVFFGGEAVHALAGENDAALTRRAGAAILALFPEMPQVQRSVVRRWPRSLPQYELGHRARMAQLADRLESLPGLHLLGNAYHGVGLPDIVRDAQAMATRLSPHQR